MKKAAALWADELKKSGWKKALLSRLDFHRGLYIGMVAECTGVCMKTAQKHIMRLVDEGLAFFDNQQSDLISDWHIKRVQVQGGK